MRVSSRVRHILEFDRIVELITPFCRTPLGVRYFLEKEPFAAREQLEKHHGALLEYRSCLEQELGLPNVENLLPLGELFAKAKHTGILFGEELLLFRRMFALGMRVRKFFQERSEKYSELAELVRKIRDFQNELAELDVLDAEGRLYDHASPLLGELRHTIQGLQRQGRTLGNSLLNDSAFSGKLQERVLSFRDGRFAVLVKKEHINSFPGILLYSSGSGNSAYMEPSRIVPFNNKLAMALREEEEEMRRIFRELTETVLSREKPIMALEKTMGFFDGLYATVELMGQKKWYLPQLEKRAFFSLKGAKHPLLGESAVPLDLRCGGGKRSVVITGPNTGGKTVALKTVAVAVLLTWHGLPAPVDEDSRIGDFDAILGDIGDEQSITQSLSTFSGHIKNIAAMLSGATDRSLVLLDELGAGTDPQEGAALGIAILEDFLQKRSLVLATTHHNLIKRFALGNAHVEAASMEFDPVSVAPTYRLIVGIPGKSNAILIAERYGLDTRVLERAREVVRGASDPLELSESRLFEKELLLEKQEQELARALEETKLLREEYQRAMASLEDEQESLLRDSDEKARQIVRDAESKAKQLLESLKKAGKDRGALSQVQQKKDALKKVKTGIHAREDQRIRKKSRSSGDAPLAPGAFVEIIDSKVKGEVLRIKGKKALVQAGTMSIEVPLHKIRRTSEPQKKPKEGQGGAGVSSLRNQSVPSSLMVRGMTVDEAVPLVEQYLDRAFRHGYGAVTVIHGRGEGILRREVHRICKGLRYVTSYTLGNPHEGGIGVTVVHFR